MNRFLNNIILIILLVLIVTTFLNVYETFAVASQIRIVSNDNEENQHFGYTVSTSGDYAIIGSNAHSAYVFKKANNNWVQNAKLESSNPIPHLQKETFGNAVCIFEDFAIIGAYDDYFNGRSTGSAYVFKNNGGTWEKQAYFTANDSAVHDHFGFSVSISKNYLIVGSPNDDDNGDNSGSAYIFERVDNNWIQHAKITSSDGIENDNFGHIVCLSDKYAVVANLAYYGNGAVYVFVLKDNNWIQQAKLISQNDSKSFGCSVSIYDNYIIIGDNQGLPSIYKCVNDNWINQELVFKGQHHNMFGSVSIYNDCAVIMNQYNNKINSGKAYILMRNGNRWEQQAILQPNNNSLTSSGYGGVVSLSDKNCIIGASHDNHNGQYSGSAYIFQDYLQYTISGQVKDLRGIPFSGARINHENGIGVKTDIEGFYSFKVPFLNWSGQITISYDDYIFEPQSYSILNITENITNKDFLIKVYTISGIIKDNNNAPIPGIQVKFSNGGGSTYSNRQGFFSHEIYHNWSGNIQAVGKGYKFTPMFRYYENLSKHYDDQIFQGNKLSISGFCYINNLPLANVEIKLTPDNLTTITDNNGFYSIDIDHLWSGKIITKKFGYIFNPSTIKFNNCVMDYFDQNFIATTKTDWFIHTENFEFYGDIIIKIAANNGLNIAKDNDMISVFVENECRGYAAPTETPEGLLFILKIWGNEKQQMTVNYYNSVNNKMLQLKCIDYTPAMSIGTINTPYTILSNNSSDFCFDINQDDKVNLIDLIFMLKRLTGMERIE